MVLHRPGALRDRADALDTTVTDVGLRVRFLVYDLYDHDLVKDPCDGGL